MGDANRSRRRGVLVFFALALLLGGLYFAVAAPYLSSRQEEMTIDGLPVAVTYADSAAPDDLKMPFYPGAKLEDSFTYTVVTKEGKPVSQYASAILTTADPWDRVAQYYSAELPGAPKPETLEDEGGKRHVLALGGGEVRTVTIRETETGSRIELLRAAEPIPPVKPIRPRRREHII